MILCKNKAFENGKIFKAAGSGGVKSLTFKLAVSRENQIRFQEAVSRNVSVICC
jgi:hypothetical protein